LKRRRGEARGIDRVEPSIKGETRGLKRYSREQTGTTADFTNGERKGERGEGLIRRTGRGKGSSSGGGVKERFLGEQQVSNGLG